MESRIAPALAFDPVAQAALRDTLLNGVTSIGDFGAEGILAVYGNDITGILRDAEYRPIIAAVDAGATRAVLAAKYEFATFNNAAVGNTAQFYSNVMNWLAQGKGTTANIVTDLSAAKTWLNGQGYSKVTLTSSWENALGSADVLVTYMDNPSAAKQSAAITFLTGGGNLFAGANGWSSATPGGNNVLRTVGASWSGNYSGSFDGTILRSTSAGNAVMAPDVLINTGNYTTAQQIEAAAAIQAAGHTVPPDDAQFAAIRTNILANAPAITPSLANPVSATNDRTKLHIEAAVLNTVPVNQLFAHRTASGFGIIPANAPRVTATKSYAVSSANAASQWLSTGLYAAPGEAVTVTVPAALVNAGWKVRVSSHSDDISEPITTAESYRRMPASISRDFSIAATTLDVGSVYGGMLYLVKPSTSGSANHSVTFANAVEAPTFILGTTTDTQWIAGIRDQPAPYAELVGNKVIITLHSSDIRTLSNPTSVVQYWDARITAQDFLGNSPNPRTYPERINDDIQISAGWMHSGYPVMAYANNLANMVDSDPGDDWGFVHEFGHNRQSGYWTFSTEGEVTNNIFGMYAFDSISGFGNTVPTDSWGEMWSSAGRSSRIASFIAGGRVRGDAGNDLATYAQLRQSFGWTPFETFFRQYQTDLPANLPTSDQQERDQWVTRFSNIVGRDLSHFFQAWGFNPSVAALAAVSGLPDWSRVEVVAQPTFNRDLNAAVTFDVTGNFADIMAGMPGYSVSYVSNTPASGTITNNGNGSFNYTPNAGYAGVEVLQITATNSFGGTATGTVTINYAAPLPRAYWRLNDGAGTAALDASGNNHTGTVSNATWTAGVLNTGALQFNGSSSKITFGTGPSLSGTTDFSVSAWIKTSASTSGVIIQQRDTNGFNGQYRLQVNANGSLQFMIYGNSAYQFDFNSTTTVNNGAWHLVTAVRQGTTGTIYIDGVPRGTATGTVRSLAGSIGVGVGADIRDSNNYFNGTIDEVRIYDLALSAARVGQLAALAPVGVASVAINDGSSQRSRVTSLTVTFGGIVTLPANTATAFALAGPGGAVPLSVDTTGSTSTQSGARLTFSGAGVEAGSLADGRYTLTVLGDSIFDGIGARIDADGNGQPGGVRTLEFHRLYGDTNGDATVNSADFLAFRLAFLSNNVAFDWDGDGTVSANDLLQFRLRFLAVV
ncbi:MAG: M60 family metallopeptidase [Gemmataceae bacterium]|nr:M60 family metallopeptidase [Gemmataceae bacterium]